MQGIVVGLPLPNPCGPAGVNCPVRDFWQTEVPTARSRNVNTRALEVKPQSEKLLSIFTLRITAGLPI